MEYYIGLDIGSASVGWAVCDESYNLCKYKKKDMWGIRLFEIAKTADVRRTNRANRRRRERKKQRIDLLQEIFADEMAKVDESFFIRLNESRLQKEDKSVDSIYTLFNDENYKDIDFYKEYPTLYHLRKDLIESNKEFDVRLVYLALHHIIKNRGHFLIEGNMESVKDFFGIFNELLAYLTDEFNVNVYIEESKKLKFRDILKNKNIAKSTKVKDLTALFEMSEIPEDKISLKEKKSILKEICKLIVGNKGNIAKIFSKDKEELKFSSFSFAEGNYEETIRPKLDEELLDKAYLIDLIKLIYDWKILDDILNDEKYISFSKVKAYENHGKELDDFRYLLLKYCDKSIYNDFFNTAIDDKKPSYSSYIGAVKKNGKKFKLKQCSREDFIKRLKQILDDIKDNIKTEDIDIFTSLIKKLDDDEIFLLQRNKDNGVIPHQVHEIELNKILENASKYLTFLSAKDEENISNIDKIKSLFKFRIPYFVGPLSDRHRDKGSNTWMVRKEDGRIYPWNFEKMVDLEKSNEAFIRRMTNKCTYLVGEDVIAKNSLLYSKFMVLNELNNLKIRGNKISVELKQQIFKDLFENYNKITGRKLLEYLRKDMPEIEKEDLSGFDIDFKTTLSSYLDFKKSVFGNKIEDKNIKNIIENIIKWLTIYGADKEMLKNIVGKEYKDIISTDELNAISKLSYNGWGNFSERFLKGIIGVDKESGESFSIIEALWCTNNNLMQLLSNNFTFTEEIEKINREKMGEIKSISYDNILKNSYASPSVKRSIWQSIEIVEEIKKIMGTEPTKIFLEMARGEEENKKGKRTISKKEYLKALYQNCEKDIRDSFLKEIEDIDESKFNSRKLFLYYTQMGKCMYTGVDIDLEELMHGNGKWDKDHIYPKSKIKDDSIDNFVLVYKPENNDKGDKVLDPGIQARMQGFWRMLLSKGFISKKKYDRLMKTGDFTEEELAGFINRQLVETRQASKVLADIFKSIYRNSELIYVKANLVSDFRHNNINMLKSRRINDYHHAKDAYLNIVVGNVYNAKFTSNPIKWLKENKNVNYNINKIFEYDVYKGNKKVWDADKSKGSISVVRTVMKGNNILYTERTYEEKGELFDATIQKKSKNASIPLKTDLDIRKYGGYNSPTSSYFSLIEFKDGKGEKIRNIIAVPLYVANMMEHNDRAFIDYCENVKGIKDVKVLIEKIKKNTLLIVDGFPLRIRGEKEKQNVLKLNMQLKLEYKYEEIIRKIEKYLAKKLDYEISEKVDKITSQDMDILYDLLLNKFNTIYKKRPANQYEKLCKAKDKFVSDLSLVDKMKCINNILNMLRCDATTTADLSMIDLGRNAGNIAYNKNTLGKSKVLMVNQSVTGLFETRIKL